MARLKILSVSLVNVHRISRISAQVKKIARRDTAIPRVVTENRRLNWNIVSPAFGISVRAHTWPVFYVQFRKGLN